MLFRDLSHKNAWLNHTIPLLAWSVACTNLYPMPFRSAIPLTIPIFQFVAVSFTLPLITPVHQHTFGNGFFLPLCCAILRTCLIFAFKFLSLHLKRPFIVNPRQHQGLLSRVAESEVFGWSRSPKNTGNRSRIFLSESGCPIASFFTSHS